MMTQEEIDEKKDILNTLKFKNKNTSAEQAKDKGYYEQNQKKEEISKEFVNEIKYFTAQQQNEDNLKTKGTIILEHSQNGLKIGDKAFNPDGLSSVGNHFVLNSSFENLLTSRNISTAYTDLPKVFKKRGIANSENFFAETLEKDSEQLFSLDNQVSNEALKTSSYDYFLNHTEEYKASLAKTLLATIDLNRGNLKETLSDILNKEGN